MFRAANKPSEHALKRRLIPLYIAAFSQGFVFWYAIEKLFIKSIGFDDASIGIMIAFYSAVMLATETPSGILADRWSRKGVLIIGSILLALASIGGGVSNSVPMYLLAAGLWGVFYALYSGTYDSVVYDLIAEEKVSKTRYEHYFGLVNGAESAALVLGSLMGGVIGEHFGLRTVYFLSVPTVLVSVITLLKFREPLLHKASATVSVKQQVGRTFRAVLSKRALIPVLVVLIAVVTLIDVGDEFGQVWVIALGAPVVLFGPINALHLASWGIGGMMAGRIQLHRYRVMVGALVVMFLCSLGLVFSRNLGLMVGCATVLMFSLVALNVVFTRLLHDSLDSSIRAGASSAVSTLGRIIIIPLSLVFGYISDRTDIFHASWISVGLVVVISIFVLKTYTENKTLPDLSEGTHPIGDAYNK